MTWKQNLGPASATAPGYLTTGTQTIAGAKTFNDTVTFNKTDEAGVAETLSTWKLQGDNTAKIEFLNATTSAGTLNPRVRFTGNGSNIAAEQQVYVPSDTGSSPAMIFLAQTTGNAALTTREPFAFYNYTNKVLSFIPLNSGANLAMSWGTQAGAAPAFTTRSAGTRMVLFSNITGSTTDYAIGIAASTMWLTSGGGYDFYYGSSTTTKNSIGTNGIWTTSSGQIVRTRTATTTPVTVATTDYTVLTNMAVASAVTVNIPGAATNGTVLIVQDAKGDAGANNITITPASGTINGAASLVISTNYGAKVLTSDGTNWFAR